MKYYKSSDVADMLDLTTQTLMSWRKKGFGPKWIKINKNTVRYPIGDFEEWMDEMNEEYDKSAYKADSRTKQP